MYAYVYTSTFIYIYINLYIDTNIYTFYRYFNNNKIILTMIVQRSSDFNIGIYKNISCIKTFFGSSIEKFLTVRN